MHAQAAGAGGGDKLMVQGGRHDPAARMVVAVLQDQQRGRREVVQVRRHGLADLLRPQKTMLSGDRLGQRPRPGRHGAELIAVDMRVLLQYDLGTGMALEIDGDLVSHGAGRNEQRRLEAEQGGRLPFQLVDGRVLAVDIVTDLGAKHGLTHSG